jgi:hypothetical protein
MKSMSVYGTQDVKNKDREARATAIRKLICEMRELGVEMREEDVKTRIETIRTTYSIHLNCEK